MLIIVFNRVTPIIMSIRIMNTAGNKTTAITHDTTDHHKQVHN